MELMKVMRISSPTRGGLVARKWALQAALATLLTASAVWGAELAKEPVLIAKPEAFESLLHPNCSHCVIEGKRRKQDLRADDRVVCWLQVAADGYVNDGAIPLRFFLN